MNGLTLSLVVFSISFTAWGLQREGEARDRDHTCIVTRLDLAQATAFYARALGWAFNDYGGEYAGIKDPDRPDHEFDGLNPHPASARGDGVLPLVRSDDVDAALASVLAAGGRVKDELAP